MDSKDAASCEHVLLLPDESKAKFGKLIKEFCCTRKNVSDSELLNQSNNSEQEHEYESKILHKGMIFVSIFIQIVLKHIATPLKMFRDFLEGFLNRGVPHRDNEQYYTFIGHLDYRLDLDKNIKREDARYYPALSMMASKLAYENKAVIKKAVTTHWKMEFVAFYDFYNEFQHKSTTQAYILREKNIDGDVIVVAFRGTSMFLADDWRTDFDFSWVKIDGMGKTHMGFMMALGLRKYSHDRNDYLGDFSGSWPKKIEQDPQRPLAYYTIREKLKEMLAGNNKNTKIIVTGHSLGGALAVLFPAVLFLHGEEELVDKLEGIYTFGQPRVGDEQFGQFMKNNMRKHNIKYNRIVFGYDIVPQVPLDDALMTFKHFGRCIHFNCFYHGKIIEEEERWEGSILLWLQIRVITTLINMGTARLEALWELIRGPFMGILKGPDYREGWALFWSRIIAIFIPSLINHSPQDYVNSTRLASQFLFSKSVAYYLG